MNKEQKNMITVYIVFFISAVLSFLPSYSLQLFGFILFFVSLITTYIYKYKSEIHSFQHSHSKYLIKTILIFSLFLMVGIIMAGILSDNSLINNTMDKVMNGIILSESELEKILLDYMQQNLLIFMVTIGPSFLYFFYRLLKGVKFVRKNKPITNPKNWF